MRQIRLTFATGREWYESLPAKKWDIANSRFIFPPSAPEDIKTAYLYYLRSEFVKHALRLLSRQTAWELDEDSEAGLVIDLRHHALTAGRRVGVRFGVPRSSITPEQALNGDLNLSWLDREVRVCAKFAAEVWDPVTAQRRHEAAVRGGSRSLGLAAADLIPLAALSTSKQAAALGCSMRKVAYLRAELAKSKK